jgi:mono/diheme cytochrome c family protein
VLGGGVQVDLVSHTISEAGDPSVKLAPSQEAKASGSALAAKPDGAAVFKQKGRPCHGPDGKGVSSIKTPDFTNPKVQAQFTDQQMTDIITYGKAGTMMPAWGGKLSDEEISAVQGFLRSLATGNQSGQAA